MTTPESVTFPLSTELFEDMTPDQVVEYLTHEFGIDAKLDAGTEYVDLTIPSKRLMTYEGVQGQDSMVVWELIVQAYSAFSFAEQQMQRERERMEETLGISVELRVTPGGKTFLYQRYGDKLTIESIKAIMELTYQYLVEKGKLPVVGDLSHLMGKDQVQIPVTKIFQLKGIKGIAMFAAMYGVIPVESANYKDVKNAMTLTSRIGLPASDVRTLDEAMALIDAS